VPGSLASCRATGIEVEEWVRAGVVDYLAPSVFYDTEINMPFGEFVALARGTPVRVYACPSEAMGPGALRPADPAAVRAGVINAWRQGVDGIYVFNYHSHIVENLDRGALLRQLSDPALLEYEDKAYVMMGGYVASRQGPKGHKVLEVLPRPFPAALRPGQTKRVPFFFGDDLATARRRGRLEAVTLELTLAHWATRDTVRFSLNGTPLPAEFRARCKPSRWQVVWEPYAFEGTYVIEFDLGEGRLLRQGENVFEATLADRTPDLANDFVLDAFALRIRYRALPIRVAGGNHDAPRL
jgi:hypothetical protein